MYPFVLYMAFGGMFFVKKVQILDKKFHFILLHLIFLLILLHKPQKAVGTFRASP